MDEMEYFVDDTGEGQDWPYRKMPKPPDKKKFEAELEEMQQKIKEKEELRSGATNKPDSAQETLRALKAEKQISLEKKARIEEGLRVLNKEYSNKSAELTKIQGNLQGFRNEKKVDEAMMKLKHQLNTTNFNMRDEKQIVAKIDSLNRAKKHIVTYNHGKRELDGMRDRQQHMREERDHYYKAVHQLKVQEDELRRKVQLDRAKANTLGKEIADLYDQKGALTQKFKVQEKEYRDQVYIHRRKKSEDFKRKKAEERQERKLAYEKDLAEYEASREPFEDEKRQCVTLIAYLRQYEPPPDATDLSPASSTSGESQDSLAQSFEKEGLVLLKKKQEDLFSGVLKSRVGKRSKKEKKKTAQNKPVLHQPETLKQFASMSIKAPSTSNEVPEAIEQLESKKKYFESLSLAALHRLRSPLPSASDGYCHSSPPSIGESAFTESIPSTPEVNSDSSPPRFPTGSEELESDDKTLRSHHVEGSHDGLEGDSFESGANPMFLLSGSSSVDSAIRRLSHDSGACEMGETEDGDDSAENSVGGASGQVENSVGGGVENSSEWMEVLIARGVDDAGDRESSESINSSNSSTSGGTVVENCIGSPVGHVTMEYSDVNTFMANDMSSEAAGDNKNDNLSKEQSNSNKNELGDIGEIGEHRNKNELGDIGELGEHSNKNELGDIGEPGEHSNKNEMGDIGELGEHAVIEQLSHTMQQAVSVSEKISAATSTNTTSLFDHDNDSDNLSCDRNANQEVTFDGSSSSSLSNEQQTVEQMALSSHSSDTTSSS